MVVPLARLGFIVVVIIAEMYFFYKAKLLELIKSTVNGSQAQARNFNHGTAVYLVGIKMFIRLLDYLHNDRPLVGQTGAGSIKGTAEGRTRAFLAPFIDNATHLQ